MNYLPIFANINKQHCLVVGGGDTARRKIKLLLKAGAIITCVATKCSDDITKLASEGKITYTKRKFNTTDINDKKLIICATNNSLLNKKISKLANTANILTNVVDSPNLSSFIMPAIVDRSPIIIAISSAGKAPILTRLIRSKLESTIPYAYGKLAELAGDFRQLVKAKFDSIEKRRYFWEQVFSSTIAEKVFSGKLTEAKAELQSKLDATQYTDIGEVYLVGGGPGNPDLLTFKALRLMQQADVVLYDRLVSPAIINLVRNDAKLIYVGKGKDNHVVQQDDINKLLVDFAKQGKRVCRLKGGDPFIFGRGGEEIETLAENNIPFQIVPGITAAQGCSTYAGIPLTHRDYSQSCRFVTGHLKDGSTELAWNELVTEKQTIVFYMALASIEYLTTQLIKHGMRLNMPVALIEKGTTTEHKVYTTVLKKLITLIKNTTIRPPTLIIIGEVVKLRAKLKWFD